LKIGACFVTLKKKSSANTHWELRWCIGSLTATRPLYEDIIINAKNAAFSDPRFQPLSEDETDDLIVEISVLTSPRSKKFSSFQKLLEYLRENKPGLIISLDWYKSTFLPSVWEELPDEEQFLVHLIYKAWLNPEYFMKNFSQAEIYVYTTNEFKNDWKNISKL
jgi:AmmeMemoRadiSam system protein A